MEKITLSDMIGTPNSIWEAKRESKDTERCDWFSGAIRGDKIGD